MEKRKRFEFLGKSPVSSPKKGGEGGLIDNLNCGSQRELSDPVKLVLSVTVTLMEKKAEFLRSEVP